MSQRRLKGVFLTPPRIEIFSNLLCFRQRAILRIFFSYIYDQQGFKESNLLGGGGELSKEFFIGRFWANPSLSSSDHIRIQ